MITLVYKKANNILKHGVSKAEANWYYADSALETIIADKMTNLKHMDESFRQCTMPFEVFMITLDRNYITKAIITFEFEHSQAYIISLVNMKVIIKRPMQDATWHSIELDYEKDVFILNTKVYTNMNDSPKSLNMSCQYLWNIIRKYMIEEFKYA